MELDRCISVCASAERTQSVNALDDTFLHCQQNDVLEYDEREKKSQKSNSIRESNWSFFQENIFVQRRELSSKILQIIMKRKIC